MKWHEFFNAVAVALVGGSFGLIAWTLLSHV
jgi:nitrate reductase NapE component